MNNARWIAPFFNLGRRRRFFGRRNNRGRMGMVLTLLGIGAGAAWYGIAQGRNNQERQPIQNMFTNTERVPTPETAFADELLPESD